MKTLRNYNKVLLGYNNDQPIYLTPPEWQCKWYWAFGWLGNRNCHYHLSSLIAGDFHKNLKEHFGATITIRPSDLYTFCELSATAYHLKETAEVLGIGGVHLTSNPCKDIIMNEAEVERINKTVLPAVFDEIYKLLEANSNNKQMFADLVEVDDKGLTADTLQFMFLNKIVPDDLYIVQDNKDYNHEYIVGFSSDDVSRIHSAYWKHYHANKKSN